LQVSGKNVGGAFPKRLSEHRDLLPIATGEAAPVEQLGIAALDPFRHIQKAALSADKT
jgi:hypothetical protein